jgi:hypothetical protein
MARRLLHARAGDLSYGNTRGDRAVACRICTEQIAKGCTALSRVISRWIDLSIDGFFLIMASDLPPERVEDLNRDPGHYKWEQADEILTHIIGDYLQNVEDSGF